MEMPVKSKVEEINLRPHEFLLPLFEVVVNAIISISTGQAKAKGLITVRINRERKNGMFESTDFVDKDGNQIPVPIESIEVIDNGLGFNDDNFHSFNTAYSERHKERGCKGVGRFTMLACFKQVQIKSVFKGEGGHWSRNFTFDVDKEVFPKDGNPQQLQEISPIGTSVLLLNFYNSYRSKSSIKAKDIAAAIIDHCLPFFLTTNPPVVIVEDEFFKDSIILNDILREVVSFEGKPENVYVKNEALPFSVQIIKRSDARINRLRLCANNRVVGKTRNLASIVPELEGPLTSPDGANYNIDVYVTSQVLNNSVNTLRNSFNLLESPDEEGSLLNEITIRDIEDSINRLLIKRYKSVIDRMQEETLLRVTKYIMDPKKLKVKYRALLSRPDLIKKIPYNATGDRLEEYLIRIKINLEKELTINLKKALKRVQPEDFEEYSEVVKNYINQEAKFAKDKLADLIIHRKGIINLINKLLKLNKSGNYALEEDLHNVIFPMGKSTNNLPYEYHNLWLLDERLAFHSFVGSDQTLKTNKHVNLESSKEADLLIFDFPWAFSEKDRELKSMVVFEFKRPGRDIGNESDKKIDSLVMKYFEDLLKDKAKTSEGELLNLEDTTPKFGFIICDLDKGLTDYNCRFNDFKKTPNGTLFKIISPLNLHIEAMTYRQMTDMSEKRHFAFFKELGLAD